MVEQVIHPCACFWRQALLVLAACQLLSAASFAVDANDVVQDVRWGFNGKVALNRFNLLSVLVANPTPQPLEGELILRKTMGAGQFVDTPIIESVSLAPFSSPRWVQFYPYVGSGYGDWKLFWGRSEYLKELTPRVAKYQRIILDDPSGLGSRSGVLKPMPETLFPSFVTATDALQVVGMDREPRSWIPGQKEAFLDWLHLGGTVVMLQGSSGKFPEFSGQLAVLNSPLDEGRHGAGRVLKVAMQRSQFDVDVARRLFVNLPKNFLGPKEKAEDPIDEVDQSQLAQAGNAQFTEGADPLQSGSFLSQLKNMTQPKHNWVLLHLMFWVYIAMIFPGCYIAGRKWSDFRVVYAGLLGTVLLFSYLFSVVGQRGYGEATAVHSVAIARALPGGAYDVASWSNVFVTSGADYTIRHDGRGALYSTCNDNESVNGRINNGVDAEFVVDIPPFSNREFAHRVKLPAGGPVLKVESFNLTDGRLSELSIAVDGATPASVKQFALYGSRFYSLNWQGGVLKLGADAGDAKSMLGIQALQNWAGNYNNPYYRYGDQTIPMEQRLEVMFKPLLSRSLNVSREREAEQVQLPADVVRVFLYAKMPAEFAVQNQKLGKQEGQVLYCIDLPLREK